MRKKVSRAKITMGSNEFDESQISEKRSSKQKRKNITIYFQHNPNGHPVYQNKADTLLKCRRMEFVCNVVKIICRKVLSSCRPSSSYRGFPFSLVTVHEKRGSANGSSARVVCKGETVVKIRDGERVYDRVQMRLSA